MIAAALCYLTLRLWDLNSHVIVFSNDALATTEKELQELEAPEVKLDKLVKFTRDHNIGLLKKELDCLA